MEQPWQCHCAVVVSRRMHRQCSQTEASVDRTLIDIDMLDSAEGNNRIAEEHIAAHDAQPVAAHVVAPAPILARWDDEGGVAIEDKDRHDEATGW